MDRQLEKIADVVTLSVKHVFTQEELLEKASIIANTVNDKAEIEAEKKAIAAEYKNKIDKLQAEIKLYSGHISNGFAMVDKAAELYLDFESNERVYMDKQNGDLLKVEPFHPSDYQKKIDFTGTDANTDAQIEFNNQVGEIADPLGDVIAEKLKSGKKEKPTPKDNLHPHYGQDFETLSEDEHEEDLFGDED